LNAILIVDDEMGIRKTLGSILEDEDYRVFTAEDALIAFELLAKESSIGLIFLDVLLPNMGGLDALGKIRAQYPHIEVVMISGHGTMDMAVRAVKQGAFDFLEKPLSLEKVLTVCRNALSLQALREENRDLKKNPSARKEFIIGTSKKMEEMKSIVRQAAQSNAHVLITGESGAGKEAVAEAVHYYSGRKGNAFIAVNCAAIPENLIESELFGYKKGAFTGASESRKGRFELADKGTLFLDEIGDMSLATQAKVLRAIQNKQIESLGGEDSIAVDARIVCATNKDLEKECKAGRFRSDLFFRINVIPISVPPLREHSEDIPILLSHFLSEMRSEKAASISFDDSALKRLFSYPWPGNVRELRNMAERIAIMHDGNCVTGESVEKFLQKQSDFERVPPLLPREIFELPYDEAKTAFEKHYLTYQYDKNGGVIAKTAESIGVYAGNLHAKLKKHHITNNERR
jgi:two-component system nitrogen regulation response regulator NtrX